MIDYSLIAFMEERIKSTPVSFNRYMFDRINWDSRMTGLTGPRGVGKSTMMLQYMLSRPSREKMLYVTADHMWFSTHSLVELADEFVKEGGSGCASTRYTDTRAGRENSNRSTMAIRDYRWPSRGRRYSTSARVLQT